LFSIIIAYQPSFSDFAMETVTEPAFISFSF
jgi:hypothetical protein